MQRLKDFDPPTDEEAPDTGSAQEPGTPHGGDLSGVLREGFLNFEIGELGTCDDDGLPTRSADLSMKDWNPSKRECQGDIR